MQAPAHSLCVNVHASQCDQQWLLCSTAIMGTCRKPTVPPFAEGINTCEVARWRMKILGHFMWNMFKSGYFCDFKHKSWYICSFYLWTLSCNRVIPLALANVLELPLYMVSWESLSVCNNRLRQRIVNISQLRNGSEWARDILGLIHVILKRGSWWWWHYQKVPFHHVATYETCFIFPKTGQCNHCIAKQAHGWGQYCHNSGAPGMGLGNPGQWLEARGLLWINVRLRDSGRHSWFCEWKGYLPM